MRFFEVLGNSQHLDGGAMFGNVPKALWKGWIPPDEQNRIPLACRCLLLETDSGKRILFDTGIGAFFEPKLKARYGIQEQGHELLKNLQKQGFDEGDIDAVILSHLHFDHAGGLLSIFEEGTSYLHFPNAYYYVGKEHWDRAQNPHIREKASFIPELQHLLIDSGRLRFIEEKFHPELENIQFRFSNGHTIGLIVSMIDTSGGPLLFLSDLVPGAAWVHLPVTMGYDRYPEVVVDEKQALFKELMEKKPTLFFSHDPQIAFASLVREDTGKYSAKPARIQQ